MPEKNHGAQKKSLTITSDLGWIERKFLHSKYDGMGAEEATGNSEDFCLMLCQMCPENYDFKSSKALKRIKTLKSLRRDNREFRGILPYALPNMSRKL